MKISTARLKQIIKEELFYREFHRDTEKLTEVESEKQRRYMCAMKDSADRPEGLSKAEAEERDKILAEAKPATDNFFDNVIVNDENSDIKKNRLELLQMFCKTYNNFIDFSKVEGA